MRRFSRFTDSEIGELLGALAPVPISEDSSRVYEELNTERQLRYLFAQCDANGGHQMEVVAAGGPHGVTLRECTRCGYGRTDEREFGLMFPASTGPSF